MGRGRLSGFRPFERRLQKQYKMLKLEGDPGTLGCKSTPLRLGTNLTGSYCTPTGEGLAYLKFPLPKPQATRGGPGTVWLHASCRFPSAEKNEWNPGEGEGKLGPSRFTTCEGSFHNTSLPSRFRNRWREVKFGTCVHCENVWWTSFTCTLRFTTRYCASNSINPGRQNIP